MILVWGMNGSDDRAPDCRGRGPGFESGSPLGGGGAVTDVVRCCTLYILGTGGGYLLRKCSTKTAVKAGRWIYEAGKAEK